MLTIIARMILWFAFVLLLHQSEERCNARQIIDIILSLRWRPSLTSHLLCINCSRSIQGMAFLAHYRELRGNDNRGLGEVEYNFGRAFHQLGTSIPQHRSWCTSETLRIGKYRVVLIGYASLRESPGYVRYREGYRCGEGFCLSCSHLYALMNSWRPPRI